MRNPTAAALAIAAVMLAVPPAAAAEATLGVDPVARCYREQSVVHLPGDGFTPIGAVKGSCKKVTAHKRLFFQDTSPGHYRVQFDTFRRYKAKRNVETNFTVTVYR